MGNTLDCIIDDETADCITVKCKEGTSFQGDTLVAADGVHSRVRSVLGLPECKFTGNTIWRGSVVVKENDALLQDLLKQKWSPVPYENYGGHTAFFVFNHHPKLPRRLNWIVDSRATSIEQDKTTPWDLIEPQTRHHEMRNVIKSILDQSRPHELMHSMKLSTIELPEASTESGWGGRGRVTLIGDAAHACKPTSGQGTSLAFEDVAVLCRKLKDNMPTSHEEWEHTFVALRMSDWVESSALQTSKFDLQMPWRTETCLARMKNIQNGLQRALDTVQHDSRMYDDSDVY